MRKVLVLLIILALAGGGGYYYVQQHASAKTRKQVHVYRVQALEFLGRAKRLLPGTGAADAPAEGEPGTASSTRTAGASRAAAAGQNQVTLYLTNGGVVTGELVSDTPSTVTLRWDYGDVDFRRREIKRMVTGKHETGENDITLPTHSPEAAWPYEHDVIIRLMRGTAADVAMSEVTPEAVIARQELDGGGSIEHTFALTDIETLQFRPIENARSAQIRENLQELFPKMGWYDEGMFTIVTDADPPTVKGYRRTVRELSTEFYLTFLPLLQDRRPSAQQFIVIFEDWSGFLEYALSDGVPGWAVLGYFHPEDEVLYLFNTLGDQFSGLVGLCFLGQVRSQVHGAVDQVKGQVDARYAATVESYGRDITTKFERAHAILRQSYGAITTNALRHELVHALFHAWGLQTVGLSTMDTQSEVEQARIAKKRAFLQSDNLDQKRQLLTELLTQERSEPLPEMQATNSWFVEGLAAYMEPSPVGQVSREWLSTVQAAVEDEQILPLEFLNTFRMGSFPQMADKAKGYAYGQSWALVHFLMSHHRDGFLRYLDRMARETPTDQDQELAWLLEAVGQELRPFDAAFREYLASFPPEEPFWLKQKQVLLDLRAELGSL